jgi:hypothetical protein
MQLSKKEKNIYNINKYIINNNNYKNIIIILINNNHN